MIILFKCKNCFPHICAYCKYCAVHRLVSHTLPPHTLLLCSTEVTESEVRSAVTDPRVTLQMVKEG